MEILSRAAIFAAALALAVPVTARVEIVPKGSSGGNGGGAPGQNSAPAPSGTGGGPVRSVPRYSPPAPRPAGGAPGRTGIVRRDGSATPRHTVIERHPDIARQIRERQRHERHPGRYYRHHTNGIHYSHYFHDGVHWYGFYNGPSIYWTRYHGGYWWWYDSSFHRWVYWAGGHWWWPGPSGLYVHVDNAYYPYTAAPVRVDPPEVVSPPEPANPPPSNATGEWKSPDGKRMVQVAGERLDAFLYDVSGKDPSFMTYLGQNVKQVRFSGGTGAKPLRILLDFSDGGFALFTADGKKIDEESL